MDSYAGIYLTGDKSLTTLLTGEIWVAGVFDVSLIVLMFFVNVEVSI